MPQLKESQTSKSIEVPLRESSSTAGAVIDRENRIISNVKIIGKESRNGRTYSDQALKNAVSLYEMAPVYLDHPSDRKSDERSVKDKIGWIENVKWRVDGNYGDFHFLESHSATPMVLEWAEKNPKGIGFSQNARGKENKQFGVRCVESIVSVRSVDLVDSPATTGGLFESFPDEGESKMLTTTLKGLVESYGSDSEKKNLALLDSHILETKIEIEKPEEEAKGVVKRGFAKAVADIAASEDGLLESVADFLAARTLLENGAPPQPPKVDGTEKELLESTREELKQLKQKLELTSLLEEHAVKSSDVRLKALGACDNKAEQMELIESWKEAGKPDRSGRLYESDTSGDAKSAFSRHRK